MPGDPDTEIELPMRTAIILRGPPTAGKTTLANAVCARFGETDSAHVILDSGWGLGEQRHSGCSESRYADLRDPRRLMVIELGYGEPADSSFPGATLNPAEWIAILEEEQRELFFFCLSMSAEVALQRKRTDRETSEPGLGYTRYAAGGNCSHEQFVIRIRPYSERTIDSDGTPDETLRLILTAIPGS